MFGVIRCTHAFSPLVRRQGGRIVLMGSMNGRQAVAGSGPYCVSKYALEGYADVVRCVFPSVPFMYTLV
jgi:NAD(P)-dependent dehydrogenase (short-subunit alcohol dehydrogenase family)